MMGINLIINGVSVTGNAGQTILEVARANNIFIPTLCNDERVKPFGSCLLCRVEVEGARGNMLACATPITEGMVVGTESDEINEARKMCLELLVSQHYGDCKAPCSMTCPAGIDVQGYIAHIANGQFKEAIKLIKERNPLPLVCGRVCTRPCEDECRRNLVDERVGIDYLKRFVSDYDINSEDPYKPQTLPKQGKKVAVIGAGPAGLSCSYYLGVLGYDVTIFERWPKGGGMLRYGIPEYRLPRESLEKEIDLIKNLGVEIKYNTTFGKDVTYRDLKNNGYEALFLGVGSQVGQPLGVQNEELEGVMTGVDFLSKVNLNSDIDFTGKRVIVIGGGNTAVDAARTSVRLNAKEVVLAYRRTRAEMPAHEMEIEEAEYEGVKLELLVAPKAVVKDESKNCASGMKFVRMQLGEPDATGRRKPEEIQGSEFTMETEVIIAAIGQTQDLSFIDANLSVSTNRNRIVADSEVMTTNVEGVFAGGDAVTGPDAAISAIAAGRKAAFAMDKYLRGEEIVKLPELYNHIKGKLKEMDPTEFERFEKIPKEKMPMLNKAERSRNFKEVELGLSEEQAKREAMRCLSCGCKDVNECKLRDYSTEFKVEQNRLKGLIERHPIDDSHEYISRDPNKCIMCGLCVRICSEQQGAGVLGFNARGYNALITPSFEMPFGEDSRCEKCGQCISACPVGALVEKTSLSKPGPFDEELMDTTCSECGLGCEVVKHISGNVIVRTTARIGFGINNGNLCEKGRFKSNEYIRDNAITAPMIRKNGVLESVSWDEAINYAGDRLKDIKETYGSDSIGVVISPEMTNEELALARKFAFDKINTKSYGSTRISGASNGLLKSMSKGYGKAEYDSIKNADLIICLGFDIKEANPVAALWVKKAAENGAKLIIINNTESKLSKFAFESRIANTEEVVSCLENSLQEAFAKAERPLVIIGDETDYRIAEALGDFITRNHYSEEGILLLHSYCNMRGLINAEGNSLIKDMQKLKAIMVFDEKDIDEFEKVPFKIMFKASKDKECKNVDVVLPALDYNEKNGTYTNSEGKTCILNSVIKSDALSDITIVEKIKEVL